MTAQELRLGNYIENAGNLFQIRDAEDLLDVETFLKHGSFKPIPLTEEWLRKFGFGKCDEHECGHNTHEVFGFYYDWHFKRFYLEAETDRVRVPHIKYVHTLQNLYFALTGEELTIKE